MLDYQLVYSDRRRTLALQIKKGQLVVRAPSFLAKTDIDQFVLTKKDWLEKKLALFVTSIRGNFTFAQGDKLYIYGEEKTFFWQESAVDSVKVLPEQVVVFIRRENLTTEQIKAKLKQLLLQWCHKDVEHYLAQHLFKFSQQMQLFPQQVKVKVYKSRWGSCNSKKQLTFNSLLAMAPRSVLNYVIIHELAHLKEMNHSARFWQLVATHQPNYRQDKLWLKQHQNQLSFS